MSRAGGTIRAALTEARRRSRLPVLQNIVSTPPLSPRNLLYTNRGYTMRLDGPSATERDAMLEFLFVHKP